MSLDLFASMNFFNVIYKWQFGFDSENSITYSQNVFNFFLYFLVCMLRSNCTMFYDETNPSRIIKLFFCNKRSSTNTSQKLLGLKLFSLSWFLVKIENLQFIYWQRKVVTARMLEKF